MHPGGGEVASLHYYFAPANPTMYPAAAGHFYNIPPHNNPPSSTFHLNRYFGGQTMLQLHQQLTTSLTPPPPPPCVSNNSTTSDEADEQQLLGLIDERKRRRMISNRESARRSRMRKQKHLDELWSQVVHLQAINRRLIDELNRVIGDRDRILHENSTLRDKLLHLQQTLENLEQMEKTSTEVPCNSSPTIVKSTNQPITMSVNSLQ